MLIYDQQNFDEDAPDSIKLCNRQLGDDYTYYMSPNTNVTRICD